MTDDALLKQCSAFHALNARRLVLLSRSGAAAYLAVQTVELADVIAGIPAVTLDGIVAKGKVLKTVVAAFDPGAAATIEALGRSMARDLGRLSEAMLSEIDGVTREAAA